MLAAPAATTAHAHPAAPARKVCRRLVVHQRSQRTPCSTHLALQPRILQLHLVHVALQLGQLALNLGDASLLPAAAQPPAGQPQRGGRGS